MRCTVSAQDFPVDRLRGAPCASARRRASRRVGATAADADSISCEPNMLLSLNDNFVAAGASDRGTVRDRNEDAFAIDPELGLLLVADGIGGFDAGDLASAKAVAAVRDYLGRCIPRGDTRRAGGSPEVRNGPSEEAGPPPDEDVTYVISAPPGDSDASDEEIAAAAVRHADHEVRALTLSPDASSSGKIGSTIVGLLCRPGVSSRCTVFHVGDSRLYRFRHRRLKKLTRDHSVYQQWIDGGCEGPPPPKNLVLQAIGIPPAPIPDTSSQTLTAGDVFLLCSDGLSNMIPDPLIEKLLGSVNPDRLEAGCTELIRIANARGGRDNVTAILAAYR